jgi:hypothetical protein
MPKTPSRRTTASATKAGKRAVTDRRKRFRIAERDGKVYDVQFQSEGKWIPGIANLDLGLARKQLERLAQQGCPTVKAIARVPGSPLLFDFARCLPKE